MTSVSLPVQSSGTGQTRASVLMAILLIVAIMISIGLIVFYSVQSDRLAQDAVKSRQERINELANELGAYFEQVDQITRIAANTVGPMTDQVQIEKVLVDIAEEMPTNFAYGLGAWYKPNAFDSNEYYYAPYVYYDDPQQPPILTHEWESEEYDHPNQEWYLNGQAANGSIHFVPAYIDSGDNSIYMAVEQAMFNEDDEFMGIMAIDVIPSLLRDIVLDQNASLEQQFFLLSSDGTLLAHPDETNLFDYMQERGDNPETLLDISESRLTDYFSQTIDPDYTLLKAEVPAPGWTVGILSSSAVMNTSVNTLRDNLILLGFLMWGVTLLVLTWLRRADTQIRTAISKQSALEKQIIERRATEDALQKANAILEERIHERTAELEVAKEEAEHANSVKSAFLASMSHELRTPLNAIINFAKFLKKGIPGPMNEEQEELAGGIADSGQHLLNLINDVLDMSKIEAGSLKLYIESDINFSQIINTAIDYTSPLLAEKPVVIQKDMPDNLPLISGDRKRLLQILLNILSNACKFTEEGHVKISVQNNFDHFLVSVEDTGHGIAIEDTDHVFSSFAQTESGLRQGGGGTGLGMPICKKLVEAHDGRIWFESELGSGTTFFVELPLQTELEPERG